MEHLINKIRCSMKKILYPMMALVSVSAFAKAINCPQEIKCNYQEGVCEFPKDEKWHLFSSGSAKGFEGNLILKLSKIHAVKNAENGGYIIYCSYHYDSYEYIGLHTTYFVKLMGEKWKFSGFGNSNAECDINSIDECGAETKE